jgi:hypothetical protein
MLFVSTIIECLISIYWLCNGTIFHDVETIKNNCKACFVSSLFSIFLQQIHWIFFTCSLHNLKCFVEDPMKEQSFDQRLKWYYIITACLSGLLAFFVFATGIFGISVSYLSNVNN